MRNARLAILLALLALSATLHDKQGNAQQPGGKRPGVAPPPPPRTSIGVKPLTELGPGTYKGETGGLYGQGRNEPPVKHQEAAMKAAARIQPLDAQGKPSASGKIGLLSVGMSNTTQEFSMFKRLADADPRKSDNVVIVDGAQGGQASEQWTDPTSDVGKRVWGTVRDQFGAGAGGVDQAGDHCPGALWRIPRSCEEARKRPGRHFAAA
jgi:hypothetical protein